MTGGVNSASLCYSQRLNIPLNTPAAASPKPFDLTSTAFLIVAFLTGIAGALQTPTLSLFLTNEVTRVRRWLASSSPGAPSLASWSASFWPGVPTEKAIKSLIVFCCLLGVFACVLFAWNRNYFILLFVGVFLSSFGSTANPQMFALAPRACRPHRAGSGDVQLDTARAGVACVGDCPPLAYALAMRFWLYGNVPSAAVAFVVCGAMVWFFLFHA